MFVQTIGVFEKWSDLLMEVKCTRRTIDCVKQLSPPKVVFLASVLGNANSPKLHPETRRKCVILLGPEKRLKIVSLK